MPRAFVCHSYAACLAEEHKGCMEWRRTRLFYAVLVRLGPCSPSIELCKEPVNSRVGMNGALRPICQAVGVLRVNSRYAATTTYFRVFWI